MIAILSLVIRALAILFVVRLALRLYAELVRPSVRRARGAAGVDMVRDRTCNTFLPRDRALQAIVAGREEHFCSAACRDRAKASVATAS